MCMSFDEFALQSTCRSAAMVQREVKHQRLETTSAFKDTWYLHPSNARSRRRQVEIFPLIWGIKHESRSWGLTAWVQSLRKQSRCHPSRLLSRRKSEIVSSYMHRMWALLKALYPWNLPVLVLNECRHIANWVSEQRQQSLFGQISLWTRCKTFQSEQIKLHPSKSVPLFRNTEKWFDSCFPVQWASLFSCRFYIWDTYVTLYWLVWRHRVSCILLAHFWGSGVSRGANLKNLS